MKKGEKGDYAVYERGKLHSFLHIREKTASCLILEEIIYPSYIEKTLNNRQTWINKGAKGSVSWNAYEICLKTGALLEAFSYTKGAFLKVNQDAHLFSKLFYYPLEELPQKDRKKIGPAPREDEPDRRAFWKPSFIHEKKTISDPIYSVYFCKWPVDNSPLSSKKITLYFSRKPFTPFPCWIEIQGDHASIHTKIVDSGKNFSSPIQKLPRRKPRFLSRLEEKETHYEIKAFCPLYFQNFSLYASKNSQKPQEIPYTVTRESSDVLLIKINKKDLSKNFYSLSLFPKKDSAFYCTFFKDL